MKQLRLLILISMLNITMHHFNFNWSDMLSPLEAYNRTSESAGSLLGILLTDQLERKLLEIRLFQLELFLFMRR